MEMKHVQNFRPRESRTDKRLNEVLLFMKNEITNEKFFITNFDIVISLIVANHYRSVTSNQLIQDATRYR